MSGPVSVGNCCRCKEPMWMTRESYETYRRNNQTFYCVHGHQQHFTKGKSDAEKLQDQLDAERRERQRQKQRVAMYQDEAKRERNRANGYKGHATKITKRAKAGVCPCCNRTFKQLAAHMANKHPQFTPIEVHEGEPA